MNNKVLKAAIAGLILTVSNYSNAALVRTTIDFTITGISGDYAAVALNEVFKFQVDYDDAGTYYDENLTSTYCLDSHVAVAGVTCDSEFSAAGIHFWSNATTNISHLFDTESMLDDGGEHFERTRQDISNVTSTDSRGIQIFVTSDRLRGRISPLHSPGLVDFYYMSNQSVVSSRVEFTLSHFITSSLPVPEPSTLAIFALGLMGLGVRRFKS